MLLLAAPPEEKSPLKTRAIIFISLALLILVGGVVGAQLAVKRAQRITGRAGSPSVADQSPAKPVDAGAAAGFKISAVVLEKANSSSLVYAVGTITEVAQKKRFGVQVEVALYDRNKQPCGTARDFQSSLEAGANWTFRALVTQKDAASARVASVHEAQ